MAPTQSRVIPIPLQASEIDSAARACGGLVGVCPEDNWAHPAMLRVVRIPTGEPAVCLCGPRPELVAWFRREASRPANDFGPMALVRIAPPDEWRRLDPHVEVRRLSPYQRPLPAAWPREGRGQ